MPLGNERRLTVAARHLVPHTSGTPFARRVPDVPLNAALNETRSRPKHFSQNLVFTIGSRNRFSPERNRLPPERKKTNHHHRKAGRAPRPPRFSSSRSTFIESSFREVTRSAGVPPAFFPCASQPRVSRSPCTGAAPPCPELRRMRPSLPRCSPSPGSVFPRSSLPQYIATTIIPR